MATINVHPVKDGSKTYRVRGRRKGQPVQSASFSSLKDVRKWATMIEGEIIAGRGHPLKEGHYVPQWFQAPETVAAREGHSGYFE